jgi:RIO kinase 1
MDPETLRRDFDRRLEEMGVRIKDADQFKVRGDVFDEVTLLALYKLANKKLFSAIGGVVATGKEGNVFYGERDGKGLAIKIYMMRTANFKAMTEYLDGDPRFSHVRRTRKDIIFAWTRKEYANLKRAHAAGIRVPEPYAFDRNILLMEFLGTEGVPYPHLRLVEMDDPPGVYTQVVDAMDRLWREAKLVHGDLSEFNILFSEGRAFFIDVGQAVTRDHPRALHFLLRDIRNVNRFFSQHCEVIEEMALLRRIAGERFEGP